MTKWHHIYIDGIDKSGKQLVGNYIKYLGKYFYAISDRGIISNIVFSRLNKRNYNYDIEQYRNCVFVHLTVDKEDWEVRCKTTNEPVIDYQLNTIMFKNVVDEFKTAGFKVIEFNTTVMTPYQIAKDIIKFMEKLNAEEQ